MTKSLKGLSGRVNSIQTTEEFISARQAAVLVQPIATFSDALGGAIAFGQITPVAGRVPTWTLREQPVHSDFALPCPAGKELYLNYISNHGPLSVEDSGLLAGRGLSTIFDEGVVNMTAPGTVTGVIDFAGDTDDITVTFTAGQTYLISLRGTGGALTDTFLELLNPSNAVI
ncbi:MAG TPA: hypothetical protein VLK25_07195, partial [Allosphingosinicella sp.]|nr:hypothetical protein [Allosphingosinicella sp.]